MRALGSSSVQGSSPGPLSHPQGLVCSVPTLCPTPLGTDCPAPPRTEPGKGSQAGFEGKYLHFSVETPPQGSAEAGRANPSLSAPKTHFILRYSPSLSLKLGFLSWLQMLLIEHTINTQTLPCLCFPLPKTPQTCFILILY